MTIVMLMSTDKDIVNTQLNQQWNPITARYNWQEVSGMNLKIGANQTIVVIAHGNGAEIGNANPETIDINATTFLALIQGNMQDNVHPLAIYISTCGPGIAQFAADVRIQAENNVIWTNTRIYGHSDPVAGPVPPPNDIRWTEIYSK